MCTIVCFNLLAILLDPADGQTRNLAPLTNVAAKIDDVVDGRVSGQSETRNQIHGGTPSSGHVYSYIPETERGYSRPLTDGRYHSSPDRIENFRSVHDHDLRIVRYLTRLRQFHLNIDFGRPFAERAGYSVHLLMRQMEDRP